jgi:transposase-like protein
MTKGEQARLMAWRLRVLQQAADEENVARVCRRFGLSRKSFYKWKQRRAEDGSDVSSRLTRSLQNDECFIISRRRAAPERVYQT